MLTEKSPKQLALEKVNARFDSDFPFYSKHHLKIRSKAGEIVPLILNYSQERLHERIERQRLRTGKVRMLILKARQQGFSTYVGGRFYHHTTRYPGKATFILSHQAETTEKLFQIVDRYHKNCPEPAKMQTDVNNRRRMVFAGIESEYFVGTAGNDDVGRGGTVQHLHASEAAFYPNGSGFSKGLLQSVPDLPTTEVIIESTANGMDELFYPMCMDAQAGKGDFELFFSPWFWQEEYRKDPPDDFVPTAEEYELAEVYKLEWSQIYWRRNKIEGAFKGNIKDFMQEYPANIEEAFISSGDSLVSSFAFMAARKSELTDTGAPLVVGIDGNESHGLIARSGIVFRRGRHIEKAYAITKKKPMELVSIITDIIDHNEPVKVFMDIAAYAVIDRLHELGYDDVVQGVDFNDGPVEEAVFLNKRAEMDDAYADWINKGRVRVPDCDVFHKESVATPVQTKTSSGLKKSMAKDLIIEKKKTALDIKDAAILTFAYPVRRTLEGRRKKVAIKNNSPSKLKTIQRRDGMSKAGGQVGFASTTVPWK